MPGTRKPLAFQPPRHNSFVIGLTRRFLPALLRRHANLSAIDVDPAGLQRLRDLQGRRVVLLPNHSSGIEAQVMFHLSGLLSSEFCYMAGIEAFRLQPRGWYLQSLGAYSIVRGTADRKSFQMTQRILTEGKRWLVVFPEGECSWYTNTVLPFQPGVVQLAFWAYEQLAKSPSPPPLYLLPAGVRYSYLQDMTSVIDASLARLEHGLGIPAQGSGQYPRLRAIGEAVAGANERKHGIRAGKDADLDERIRQLREVLVSQAERTMGVTPRAGQPLTERIRHMINTIDRMALNEVEGGYGQSLREEARQRGQLLHEDLQRALRFLATRDGYVGETMTQDRFLDALAVLEEEVLKKRPSWGPRKATVLTGEPINIADHFGRYQSSRQEALSGITTRLESSVRNLLESASA